jgi:hypothetical protein
MDLIAIWLSRPSLLESIGQDEKKVYAIPSPLRSRLNLARVHHSGGAGTKLPNQPSHPVVPGSPWGGPFGCPRRSLSPRASLTNQRVDRSQKCPAEAAIRSLRMAISSNQQLVLPSASVITAPLWNKWQHATANQTYQLRSRYMSRQVSSRFLPRSPSCQQSPEWPPPQQHI